MGNIRLGLRRSSTETLGCEASGTLVVVPSRSDEIDEGLDLRMICAPERTHRWLFSALEAPLK
jgi:hypothetical protein